MGTKIVFEDSDEGWFAGSGKSPRGIYLGDARIEEVEAKSGDSTYWNVIIDEAEVWVPVEGSKEGKLVKLEETLSVTARFFLPKGDDPKKDATDREKILGVLEAMKAGRVTRGKAIDPTRMKGRLCLQWDPAPPGRNTGFDQARPLREADIEKLESDDYRVISWPHDNAVQRAGAKEGDAQATGRRRPQRGNRFEGKGKKKAEEPVEAPEEEDEEFLDDDEF